MDDSLKDVLTRHWQTLVRYINPTASLIGVLVDDKILPSAMIDDIKKGTTVQEKNDILLKSIKLRGNTSYRKFRDAMMKCGQIFIADLLFEEDSNKVNFVEESDVSCIPSLKLSLTPEEIRQLVITLNARVKSRVLKSEWRRDSQQRMDILQARSEEYRAVENMHYSAAEHEHQIKQLTSELSVKNDIIRSLSLDINVLNQEVLTFTQTYQVRPSPRQQSTTDNNSPSQVSSRFRFFDTALIAVNKRLNVILGDASPDKPDERVRMDQLEEKTLQVLQMVRELEGKVMNTQRDHDDAIQMLLPGRRISSIPMVHAVQRFQMQEQKYRYSLLKDIDRLSRKLRGMTVPKPTSGLFALRQSAVTGLPSPGIVDFRFLSNHISLLEADAEHLQKRLAWKDAELKALKEDMSTGKLRIPFADDPHSRTLALSVDTPKKNHTPDIRVNMASEYMLGVLTAWMFLDNAGLKLVTSAAINVTDLQLENPLAHVKSLDHWPVINFSNITNNSSSSGGVDGGDIIGSDTDNGTTQGTHPVATRGPDIEPLPGNVAGSSPGGAAGAGKGHVMALSDDVITDALFTNIDTLQDQLEICEEELRQKLKLSSYYQLLQQSNHDAASNADNDQTAQLANDVSDDNVNVPHLDVDEERSDDSDDSLVTDEHPRELSQTSRQQVRQRRFAVIAETTRPLSKSDILSQKVVERLSERMSYLRSSLVQCHLLVRQFG